MNIGGLQKVSLIDYPGLISTVIFTNGCPFRCGFCHNPGLVIPPFETTTSELEVFDYLERRRGKIQGVVITGGEPLMQDDILAFCKKLKCLDYKVKLDTNGYYPKRLRDVLKRQLIDYIAMDIKSPLSKYLEITQRPKLDLTRVQESIHRVMDADVPYEFRTTLIEGYHSLKDVAEMSELITGAHKLVLQAFQPRNNLVGSRFDNFPATTPEFMQRSLNSLKPSATECEIR